jgi:hypothetical protein
VSFVADNRRVSAEAKDSGPKPLRDLAGTDNAVDNELGFQLKHLPRQQRADDKESLNLGTESRADPAHA